MDLCRQTGLTKIHRVILKIGNMKNVNPDLIISIFSMLSKNSPIEGANLLILSIPVTLSCMDCKKKSYREDNLLKCPHCGSLNVKLLTGLEFAVESVEVEKNLE